MRDFFNSLRFKILMAVLAVVTGVMIYSASTGGLATLPEQMLSYALMPFQKLSSTISDGFTGIFSVFFDARKNYDENQQLKREIAELRRQLVDYENVVTENERLREILDLKELNPDIRRTRDDERCSVDTTTIEVIDDRLDDRTVAPHIEHEPEEHQQEYRYTDELRMRFGQSDRFRRPYLTVKIEPAERISRCHTTVKNRYRKPTAHRAEYHKR